MHASCLDWARKGLGYHDWILLVRDAAVHAAVHAVVHAAVHAAVHATVHAALHASVHTLHGTLTLCMALFGNACLPIRVQGTLGR